MESFNEHGLSNEQLDTQLQAFWEISKLDPRSEATNLFDEGRHLISCDALPWGDEVRERVVRAYTRFIHGEMWATGDGARAMERDIVAMMGDLLGEASAVGRTTTGGSESVLSAMALAKYRAFTKRFPGLHPSNATPGRGQRSSQTSPCWSSSASRRAW